MCLSVSVGYSIRRNASVPRAGIVHLGEAEEEEAVVDTGAVRAAEGAPAAGRPDGTGHRGAAAAAAAAATGRTGAGEHTPRSTLAASVVISQHC